MEGTVVGFSNHIRASFAGSVEKRYTSLHSKDFIGAAVTGIEVTGSERKVNLETPDKILLIEVVGGLTGMAIIKPRDVLAVLKEKML